MYGRYRKWNINSRGGLFRSRQYIWDQKYTSLCHFHNVILYWICNDRLVKISGKDYCKNENRMNAIARDFSDGSNHLFSGCIGAVDGWIVEIRKPRKKDGVLNPKSFYSRKGFYGLSVHRPLLIKRKVYSSTALSPEVLSTTPLHSRERVCTNGSWTTIGMS